MEERDFFLELTKDDWDSIVSHREKFGVFDKIQECQFFYSLMESNNNWDQFRWLTSAFLGALRSVTFWLSYQVQNEVYDDEGDTHPDEEAIQKLSPYLRIRQTTTRNRKGQISFRYYADPVHPLLMRLNRHRIQTVHYGSLWIKPKKVASASQFVFREGEEGVLKFGNAILELFDRMLGEAGEIGYETPE
jgi:hypothetical protein